MRRLLIILLLVFSLTAHAQREPLTGSTEWHINRAGKNLMAGYLTGGLSAGFYLGSTMMTGADDRRNMLAFGIATSALSIATTFIGYNHLIKAGTALPSSTGGLRLMPNGIAYKF